MGKKSRRTKTSAPVETQVDPEREDSMDDEDDADVPGLPLGEGASIYEQIAAVLTGSDDAEIALVLGQAPIEFALKLRLGMQKLSASADAFGLLAEYAENSEPDTLGFIFRKVAGLTSAQVDADIRNVVEPTRAEAILNQPGWNRRRLLFLSLAAPYLDDDDDDDDGMQDEEAEAAEQPPTALTADQAAQRGAGFAFGVASAQVAPDLAFGAHAK